MENQLDKTTISSHDRFFKELFSKKEEASEFIAKTLPKEIVEKIDFQSLEIDKTEYIDSKLRTNFSDVVYNCKYGSSTNIKVSLLFEHKSYPEMFPHLQLLGYMHKIWEAQMKQKQKLTHVIPIIFYHGERKWEKKTFESYFDKADEALQNYIPRFDYQLIDTSDYTDDQIIELFRGIQLQLGMLILKNIFDEQQIIQKSNKIFGEINQLLQNEQGERFFETVATYLIYSTQLEILKFVEKMRTISPKAGEKFISTAKRLEMKGRLDEKKKVAYSMIKKNYTDIEIIELTGLTQVQLDYLKTLKEFELELEIL